MRNKAEMILDVMQKRRSVRRFKAEQLPDETMLKLAEAAVTAPSAANKQPWRFLMVKNKSIIEAAASVVDEERRRIRERLRPEFRKDFDIYSDNFAKFRNAPALIIPLYRVFEGLSGMLDETATSDDVRFFRSLEHHTTLVSVSLSIENILLMAQKLGVGACCMTGPLIAESRIAKCFDVPEGWRIAAIVAVGYPAEEPQSPGRKPLSSVIKWL